jgi:hypothetical protein
LSRPKLGLAERDIPATGVLGSSVFLLAGILEGKCKLVEHLVTYVRVDADPSRLSQPRRNVYSIAEDIAVLDDVAEIDPYTELYTPPLAFRSAISR